jgi:hypothetical protein
MDKSSNKFNLQSLFWGYFDGRRTREMHGDVAPLCGGIVSMSVPMDSSHREAIEEMARKATYPFAIAHLSERLNEIRLIRGRTYFGQTGLQIDNILQNYPGMRWWMQKDGLVIDTVPPNVNRLSEVDRKSGKLICEGAQNRRLSADAIRQIARELDAAGFVLKDNLQPAQWKPIAD